MTKWGYFPFMCLMEQLIKDIQAYADAVSKTPQWVLRAAIKASWGQWDAWKEGRSSPTMAVADRVRDFMRANPPPQQET